MLTPDELVTLERDSTEDESARIKALIRNCHPLARELAARWPVESDEVSREDDDQ